MFKSLLKKILPNSLKQRLIEFRYSSTYLKFQERKESLFLPLKKLTSKSKLLTALYYLLFDSSFKREMRSVLAGQVEHIKLKNDAQGNLFQLKRNVHRIEKGLIMKPRRKVFALDYIEQTVDTYLNLRKGNVDKDVLDWSNQVLSMYFDVIELDEYTNGLLSKFKGEDLGKKQLEAKVPYERDLTKNPVSYDDFMALNIKRRSVRWYEDKPVPKELIDKALLAANQSPSACNRQPFRYMIFDEPELVQKIVNIPKGTPGYSHNIKTVAVLIGDLSAYFSERDRHVIYIDASLSAMSFILGLETLGLSSCCINWPDVEKLERKMEKLINLEKQERPIMLISIGYPDKNGMVPYSQKQSIENLRTYNHVS